ncbi:hypothetical protein QLQ80_03260 [Mycoplasma sp. M5725]|uniref:Uncharacterized protein n=1 Tax=Mycoplasma phocimorsus TaxID=3045839 RepID=A0AAJ1PRP0_9MOLU|nr:hypothetical protein [Mycoplasma phocimorsus]MDJ1646082.1 hypothetical protein [Mycoplasma phocimorsus]
MNKKIKTLLATISAPIITLPLISTKNFGKQFSIYYSEIDNIYINNLTRSYTANQNTNLNIPKTKEGYIFVNWVYEKYNFPLDNISSLETGDIVLKPNLIKEYQGFKEAKISFLSSNNKDIKLLKLLDKIVLSYGYKKLKLQEEFTEEYNNLKLNEESIIENVDLENESLEQDIKNHLQGFVSNTLTFPEARLQTFKTSNPRKFGILSGLFSNFGLKEYLVGGFLSLFGLGALGGVGYGIHKAIEYQRLLDKSKNYELTLEVENEKHKDKHWSIYGFAEELAGGKIGTFSLNDDKKNDTNNKFTNKGNGKFSIRLENINDPSKVSVTLKIKTDNEEAENQTNSFDLNNIIKNGSSDVYISQDLYSIKLEGKDVWIVEEKRTPIPLGKVYLKKVI